MSRRSNTEPPGDTTGSTGTTPETVTRTNPTKLVARKGQIAGGSGDAARN
jgi:hypothetical protein